MTHNSPHRNKRLQAYQLGLKAETLCCWWLRLRGYRILHQRYQTPYGEIDIIARRRKHLHIIEVKARGTLEEGAYSITPKQSKRIRQATEVFLCKESRYSRYHVHGDVMLVAKGRWPHYIQGALTG